LTTVCKINDKFSFGRRGRSGGHQRCWPLIGGDALNSRGDAVKRSRLTARHNPGAGPLFAVHRANVHRWFESTNVRPI